MTGLVLRWIAHAAAIYMASAVFDGMRVDSVRDAILAGAVLGILNTLVRPLLVLLTLPVTVLTLGLFYFVVSAFCLWLTSWLLPGFELSGMFTAFFATLLVSFLSTVITSILHGAAGTGRKESRS